MKNNNGKTTAAAKTTSQKSRNIYAGVTQKIIEKMKAGKLVWNAGFRRTPAMNFVNQATYRGINAIILNFLYDHEPCPLYATFKQIRLIGGMVKKGSKGKLVIFYKTSYKKDGRYIDEKDFKKLDAKTKQEVGQFSVLKHYYVYNLMDTEKCKGFDYSKYTDEVKTEKLEDIAVIGKYYKVLENYKDKPDFGTSRNKNFYSPNEDRVCHVPLNVWDDAHQFAATVFHELIHSTGHKKRLNRPGIVDPILFGSKKYANEELIAELGAAFLCQETGILPKSIDNTAAYLQSWIKVLEDDERLIFKAAAQAQKAFDHIMKE